MLIKIHKSYRSVIAVCDSEILGEYFEEGERILDIREDFYNGDEINESELIEAMKNFAREDATFNIAGEKTCKAALKAGIVSEEGIKKVSGIPFALVLL